MNRAAEAQAFSTDEALRRREPAIAPTPRSSVVMFPPGHQHGLATAHSTDSPAPHGAESQNFRQQIAGLAAATAGLLTLGRSLERASLLLTTAAVVTLLLASLPMLPRIALLAVLAAGLVGHFFALRTAFEQPVFAAWARRWHSPGADLDADLASFDAAIAGAALHPAPPDSLRPLGERIAGARRQVRRQGFCCLLQLTGALAALLAFLTA